MFVSSRVPTRRRGFTLVELSVVVLGVLILGAISTVLYQRFVDQSEDAIVATELDAMWQDIRARAELRGQSPIAAMAEVVADANAGPSQWDFIVHEADPATGVLVPWVSGTDLDADDAVPPCARLVVPDTNTVEIPPIAPCAQLLSSGIERFGPMAWYPLDGTLTAHREGLTATASGSVEFGCTSAPACQPSSPHAASTLGNGQASARISSGGAAVAGLADSLSTSDGFTIALWALPTSTTATGDLMHVPTGSGGVAVALTLVDTTTDGTVPACRVGDWTAVDGEGDVRLARAAGPLTVDEWHQLACRVHPSGQVSLIVDGREAARTSPSTVPAPGGDLWVLGGPAGERLSSIWLADDAFVHQRPIDEGFFAALWTATNTTPCADGQPFDTVAQACPPPAP